MTKEEFSSIRRMLAATEALAEEMGYRVQEGLEIITAMGKMLEDISERLRTIERNTKPVKPIPARGGR